MPPIRHRHLVFSGAFTLIEMLVSIAIVSVLMVLIFGVQSGVQARVRQAKCAANLSTQAKAVMLFAADNNGRFPYGWNVWYPIVWQKDISPYLGIPTTNTRSTPGIVFQCPMITQADINTAGAGSVSHGMNEFIIPQVALQSDTPVKTVQSLSTPSRVPLLGDIWLQNSDRMIAISKVPAGNTGNVAFRHTVSPAARPAKVPWPSGLTSFGRGKVNIFFCDGHAEALSPEEVANAGDNVLVWNPWK